jgi:hypothetical protein
MSADRTPPAASNSRNASNFPRFAPFATDDPAWYTELRPQLAKLSTSPQPSSQQQGLNHLKLSIELMNKPPSLWEMILRKRRAFARPPREAAVQQQRATSTAGTGFWHLWVFLFGAKASTVPQQCNRQPFGLLGVAQNDRTSHGTRGLSIDGIQRYKIRVLE